MGGASGWTIFALCIGSLILGFHVRWAFDRIVDGIRRLLHAIGGIEPNITNNFGPVVNSTTTKSPDSTLVKDFGRVKVYRPQNQAERDKMVKQLEDAGAPLPDERMRNGEDYWKTI